MAKICFLADAESIHTRKWINYFSNFDNEIYLISMRDTKYKYSKNVKTFVVKPPFQSKLSYFFIVSKIKKLVNEIKPDILHSHYATSYGLFGRLSGYHPFIVSVWGSDVYDFPNSNAINAKLLRYILNGADAVCSTSMDMANETRKYYKNKKDITITPFGVDINKFKESTSVLQKNYITIGVMKNLNKVYGIDYLINAFSDLCKESDKDIRLMIVGDGEERQNLEGLCTELNIENKVTFTGKVDNVKVPEYINMMDIVCIPSLRESFGVAAVEACACGRPVVSTNVGGLTEIVFNDLNGYTVEPKNSKLLKEKLKILIEDEDKIRKFSVNARKLVEDKYNWIHNAETMKKLYDSFLISGGKTDEQTR
ncbi:glycosyl transferase family 1 [Clostridium carboxidivorans P7]|uniref:Glycosyl transferase group 1 n=2 Tax=Clostridium TaxID=1485 RepID=C6PW75_9CLOT|nr:glycosyltransferase [Clostridium carboxidivorans]AKN32511.1 glycosyl transferase family 1 [Clostridium carboxidivorans P7]EET86489.1 glycosyl transferase group 1 [Clostridium carboxidivorans P7]